MGDRLEHRQAPRVPASKPVTIIMGKSIIECTIVDESATGLRVRSDAAIDFPLHVIVELRSGERWNAVTRWQRGLDTGLKYENFLGLTETAKRSASLLFEQVHRFDAQGLLRQLDERNCFGQDRLRTAATAACQSVQVLETLLLRLSGRAPSSIGR